MKDSIQVRMCNLNIVNRSQEEVDASLEDSVSKYSGRKNFKKFVKVSFKLMKKRFSYYYFVFPPRQITLIHKGEL